MSTTPATFVWYNKGKGKVVGGTIDLDAPDLRVLLTTSAYTPDAANHDYVSDITHEVAGGTGYARYALVAEAKSEPTAGTWMLDSDDPTWTASGGSIVARYWVLYSFDGAGDASSELIAYGLLNSADLDVTTTTGNVLTYNVPATGWFRWS